MRKKRIILFSLAAFILIAVGTVGSIIAYFTDKESTPNEAQIGIVAISVKEDPAPEKIKTVDKTTYYQKNVSIQNAAPESGALPCYVRVRIDFTSSEIQNKTWFSNAGDDAETAVYNSASDYTAYAEKIGDKWVYKTGTNPALDGYFYYTDILMPGAETSDLLKWVKTTYVSDESDEFNIYIYSEAVQTIGKDGNNYNDYESAWKEYLGITG